MPALLRAPIVRRSVHSGKSHAGKTAEAIWMMPPAAMTYATATR